MRGQKTNPGRGNGLVIQMGHAMVRGERLNARAHLLQRRVERLPMQVQPGQPEMVGMPESEA